MNLLDVVAVLITLSAAFSYVNYRFVGLPGSIGVMLIALCMSLALIGLGKLGFVGLREQAKEMLEGLHFNQALLQGMLSFLLFAGALQVNLSELRRQRWIVMGLASGGVIVSTAMVGVLSYYLLAALGEAVPLVYCLLFGALISPTDPIAVLAIIRQLGAPRPLQTIISGESLFNDGVGVVAFIVLVEVATGGAQPEPAHIAGLLAHEVVGGIGFGLCIGLLGYWMLKTVDNYQVETLITLALVTGGYALASALHVSGPIAVVVAGLLTGNQGRAMAMSEKTRRNLDTFWELVDEILNAVLFVMIGMEVLVLTFRSHYLIAGLVVIPVVLFARLLSVGTLIGLTRLRRAVAPGTVKIMTWGGLRGGISVALALSLPPAPERDLIVFITYAVVVFSILVQGTTVRRLMGTVGPRRLEQPP